MQGERNLGDIAENNEVPKDSSQHTQFRPVKPGVKFKFRLYFENLTDRELGALCWALHPLGDPKKEYCHQLGMGKPLGMGAVKLEAKLYLTDRYKRYTTLFAGDRWQTGAAAEGETLSDRSILERRIEAFEAHVLEELGLKETCKHLSEVQRIAMLLKMMEWPGYPPVPGSKNLYLGEEGRPNTRYMTIRPNEFEDRPVLPDPSAFGELTGTAVPSSGDTNEKVQKKMDGRMTGASTPSAEDVRRSIKALRGKGEVSKIPEIVAKMEQMADDVERRACAKELEQWLVDHRLWGKKPHAESPWHQKIARWLS